MLEFVRPLILPLYDEASYPMAESVFSSLHAQGSPVYYPEVGLKEKDGFVEEVAQHGLFVLAFWDKKSRLSLDMRFAFLKAHYAGDFIVWVAAEGVKLPTLRTGTYITSLRPDDPYLAKKVQVIYDDLLERFPLPKRLPKDKMAPSLFRILPFAYECPHPDRPLLDVAFGFTDDFALHQASLPSACPILVRGEEAIGRHDYVRTMMATLLQRNGSDGIQFVFLDPYDEYDCTDMLWARVSSGDDSAAAVVEFLYKEKERRKANWGQRRFPAMVVFACLREGFGINEKVPSLLEDAASYGIYWIVIGNKKTSSVGFQTILDMDREGTLVYSTPQGIFTLNQPSINSALVDDILLAHTPITAPPDERQQKWIDWAKAKEYVTLTDLKDAFGLSAYDTYHALEDLQGFEVIADYFIEGKGYPRLMKKASDGTPLP
ncbi:MAG: hypothetical protein K6E59_01725 [Bacilli bacterium]|nr:hypothetical protein [Bacilli bacterium]